MGVYFAHICVYTNNHRKRLIKRGRHQIMMMIRQYVCGLSVLLRLVFHKPKCSLTIYEYIVYAECVLLNDATIKGRVCLFLSSKR